MMKIATSGELDNFPELYCEHCACYRLDDHEVAFLEACGFKGVDQCPCSPLTEVETLDIEKEALECLDKICNLFRKETTSLATKIAAEKDSIITRDIILEAAIKTSEAQLDYLVILTIKVEGE